MAITEDFLNTFLDQTHVLRAVLTESGEVLSLSPNYRDYRCGAIESLAHVSYTSLAHSADQAALAGFLNGKGTHGWCEYRMPSAGEGGEDHTIVSTFARHDERILLLSIDVTRNIERTSLVETRQARLEELVAQRVSEQIRTNRLLREEIALREKTTDELRKSEEKYKRMVESLSDGVVVLDGEKVIFCNRAFCRIFGCTEQESLGKDLAFFLAPSDLGRFRKELGSATGEGRELPLEFRGVRQGGREMVLEATVAVGTPFSETSVILVLRDVSARRRLESELTRMQRLESLGLLAGGIAHDFNNILTGILGNISLAQCMIQGQDETVRVLGEAQSASLRARDLTAQLLSFARGGQPIKKIIDIAAVVRRAADFSLHGSPVSVEYSVPADLWPVDADENQIGQMVSNLLINARQAMPVGGTVQVRFENITIGPGQASALQPGQYVCLTVRDEGEGIQAENLSAVFDPFFTTKEKGSGLGLTICYSVVKRHNGIITVQSAPGTGASFLVYLPAARPGTMPVTPAPTAVAATGGVIEGNPRILILDDEEFVRKALSQILIMLGCVVETSEEGSEAIEMYRQALSRGEPYQAVIMDLTIRGGMGGRDAVRRIKVLDPEVRAIVSSGYSDDPVMAEYERHGFCGVIAKPYRVEDIQAVLSSILSKK